jgi:hypothetical protein
MLGPRFLPPGSAVRSGRSHRLRRIRRAFAKDGQATIETAHTHHCCLDCLPILRIKRQQLGRLELHHSPYAHAPDRREIARGELVRDGWLRFQSSDADYRKLVNTPDLWAIVTVDREAGRILGVKFLGRRPLT